jgi:hypothetical protein
MTPIATEIIRSINEADVALLRAQPVSVRMGTALRRLRDSHHRIAQLAADGVKPAEIARQLGYSLSRIYVLLSDPAFKELISHYREDKAREYLEFHAMASMVGLDALQEIHMRMEEDPDKIPLNFLREVVKDLADRTGHAPVSRSVSVNVHQHNAERLGRARARLSMLDHQVVESGPTGPQVVESTRSREVESTRSLGSGEVLPTGTSP